MSEESLDRLNLVAPVLLVLSAFTFGVIYLITYKIRGRKESVVELGSVSNEIQQISGLDVCAKLSGALSALFYILFVLFKLFIQHQVALAGVLIVAGVLFAIEFWKLRRPGGMTRRMSSALTIAGWIVALGIVGATAMFGIIMYVLFPGVT